MLKKKLALIIIMHGLALADGAVTRSAARANFHEQNPVMRPFVHGPQIYFAVQGDVFLADYLLLRHPHAKVTRAAVAEALAFHTEGVIHTAHALAAPAAEPKLPPCPPDTFCSWSPGLPGGHHR